MSTAVNTLNLSAILSLLDDKISMPTRWTFVLFAINFGLGPMGEHVGSSHLLDVKYLSERFRMEPRRLRRDLKMLTEQKLIISSLHQKKYRPTRYFEVSGRIKEHIGQFKLKDRKRFVNEIFGETIQPKKPAQLNVLMQCVLALHERHSPPESDKTITLSEAERFLLLVLLMHSDISGIVYNSKTSMIRKLTGLSKQSINIYLASLRQKGLIRQTVCGLGQQPMFVDYGAIHVLNLSHPVWQEASIYGHFFIIPFAETSACVADQILALAQHDTPPSENELKSIAQTAVQSMFLESENDGKPIFALTRILGLWRESFWSKPSAKTQLTRTLLPKKNLLHISSDQNIIALVQTKGEQLASVSPPLNGIFRDAIFKGLWDVDPSNLLHTVFPNESWGEKQELGKLIYAIGALTAYPLLRIERIARSKNLNWLTAAFLPQGAVKRNGAVIYMRSKASQMPSRQDQYHILEDKKTFRNLDCIHDENLLMKFGLQADPCYDTVIPECDASP